MANKAERLVSRLGMKKAKVQPKEEPKEKAKSKRGVNLKDYPTTSPAIDKDHDRYMAEEDARTVARAHAIKADPERAARAAAVAQKMVNEKSAELRGLRSICKRG